ncbi:MAG: NAD-dependent epimerase/dehydratase family protein [Haloarculaceae archaeon]
MSDDRVLVTGAAGFVGRHLVPRLLEGAREVVATDVEPDPPERYAGRVDGESLSYVRGDLTERSFRQELLAEPFDRVFHLAAVVGVNAYLEDPLSVTEVNVVATERILRRVADWDVRFVFASTSEVYGRNPDVPWSEEDDRVLGAPTIDRWSYATSKSACEHMLHGLSSDEGPFEATVVRPFNLYGPGQRPDFVLPAFVDRVVSGESPTVYDGGDQTRCFTYVEDFVEGVRRASTRSDAAGEAFNLGSTRETRIRDLAEMVVGAADADLEPEFVDGEEVYGDSYEDLERRVPDVSKARAVLDWEATTTLEEGIERVLSWRRERERRQEAEPSGAGEHGP